MFLGFSLWGGRPVAKVGTEISVSIFVVSLRPHALPLLFVPSFWHLWVSPPGLYNGQEEMAGLLNGINQRPDDAWDKVMYMSWEPWPCFGSSWWQSVCPSSLSFGGVWAWPAPSATDSAHALIWSDCRIWFQLPIFRRMSPRRISLLCWEVMQKQWRA